MKINPKFVVASIVMVTIVGAVFTACRKNNSNTDPNLPGNATVLTEESSHPGMKKIPQKTYITSSEELSAIVKTFKSGEASSKPTFTLDPTDPIPVDSATWLLEACLNYDYDYEEAYFENFKTFTKKISRTISVDDDQFVTAAGLVAIYDSFRTAVDSVVGDSTKLKVIDLESYDYDKTTGTVLIEASASFAYITLLFQCNNNPFSTGGNYYIIKPATHWPTNVGCNFPGGINSSIPAAKDIVNQYINCWTPLEAKCTGKRIIWTNVIAGAFLCFPSWNPWPNELYCSAYITSANLCSNPSYNIATGSTLNAYFGPLKTLAHTFGPPSPPSPPNLKYIDSHIDDWPHPSTPAGSFSLTWRLYNLFGTKTCVEIEL